MPAQPAHQPRQPAHRDRPAEAGRHHQVGAAALLGVRHLLGQDSRQPGFRHPGTGHDALALNPRRRRHDQHQVAAPVASALQQQRHVEHYQPLAAAPAARQEARGLALDQRVHDRLQPGQRRGVTEHPGPERLAVDRAVAHDSGKGRGNRRDRGTARRHQAMDRSVSIMHRQPQPPQHGGGRRLAHAD